MQRPWIWWLLFVGIVAFPFAFAEVFYDIARLSPGSVKMDHWRYASSGACVAAVGAAIVVLYRERFNVVARVALGCATALFLLFAAAMFQMRSMCGDEPLYVGDKVDSAQVSACG
jgi:uncharacterized membrane protein